MPIVLSENSSMMEAFRVNDKIYSLEHDNEDDCRVLVDDHDNPLLKFNCSLRVYDNAGCIGDLESFTGQWKLQMTTGEVFETGIPVDDYHWKRIFQAEIAICKNYIMSKTPKIGVALETEGGACD